MFSEQVRGELAFSDGKYILPKDCPSKGRLHDYSRSEGCVPFSSNPQGLSKVSTVPLEKQVLCLSRPMFWLKYRSKGFHKTFKTDRCLLTQTGCPHDPLSGRFSNPGLVLPRSSEEHNYGSKSLREPRFHCQSGKVAFNPNSSNNFPWFCNKLHSRSTEPPRGERFESGVHVQERNFKPNYACSPSGKPSGHPRVLSSGNLASAPTFPLPTDPIDPCFARKRPELRCDSFTGSQLSERTQMVGVEHRLGQQQSNYTPTCDPLYNNRCNQDRVGCGLPRAMHEWALVGRRTIPSHKRIRTQGCLSGPEVFFEEPVSQSSLSENGQHNGSRPCKQQGRRQINLSCGSNIGTLAMVPEEGHYDISSTCTRQIEHNCRQGIEGVQRHQRLENRPSDYLPFSEGVRNRLVCFSPNRSASQVRELETGSRGTALRCPDNELGTLQGVCFPSLQPHFGCSEQSDSGRSRHHISSPQLASPAMVASPPQSSGRATSPHPEHETSPQGPSSSSKDTSNVPQTTLSRVSHIRGQYQAMGISENVTEILLSASRPSTRRTYKSAWGRWSRWCDKRKVDPFSAPIADILLYLTEYFNGGAAYRSVNVARSAISTTHAKLDGLPVGQHPLVTQLLKAMFNNRPPGPRYSHTWDVASVTKYLASLGNNRSLSLKQLSFKLAMLFSLTCPERVSALTKLDLRHCRVLPEGVEFTLSAPRKRGSTDQLPKAFFARFPSNSKLCPVESLRSYLKATRTIRATIPSSKVDPLFISYVKPHKPRLQPRLSGGGCVRY